MPNLEQIGGGHCKTLIDLTWNDHQVSIENDRLYTSKRLYKY